eukprot:4573684-Prymnesium_polylepis.1
MGRPARARASARLLRSVHVRVWRLLAFGRHGRLFYRAPACRCSSSPRRRRTPRPSRRASRPPRAQAGCRAPPPPPPRRGRRSHPAPHCRRTRTT